ncbi:fimbrial protein [Bacillus sp. JJ1503]|uniref:fimbrial protein n=1 Tax=unclassified Bacillus (in: firmicutes) TaxID=185979 RepID=UPI002FFD9F3A
MLIEINLLPKKESRNTSLVMLACVLGIILLLGIGSAVWVGQSYKGKLDSITQQQSQIQKLIAIEQEKVANAESLNSLDELEKAVNWAHDYPIKTVPILRKFTALLPERGFVQTFSYEETGNIVITVQFDTSREASYYLKSMLDSDWIEDAAIRTLTTTNISEEDSNEGHILEPDKEKILPRYLAEYEIIINRSVIKQDVELVENGGDES